jgi:RNA polymerase sigma-70 factor, ECF subfamily
MDHDHHRPTNAPSPTPVATQQLLERAAAGDQDAARELYDRYFRRLLGLARSRLDGLARQKVDAEDVVQSAFKSFFVRLEDGQFSLDESGDVWPLLVRITLRKCGHKLEHWSAACRDTNRDATPSPSPDDSHAVWEPIARGPSPLEGVIFAETVERLLAGFEPRDATIVSLRVQGATEREIGTQVGCTERTVRRVLERLRKRAERMHENEDKR